MVCCPWKETLLCDILDLQWFKWDAPLHSLHWRKESVGFNPTALCRPLKLIQIQGREENLCFKCKEKSGDKWNWVKFLVGWSFRNWWQHIEAKPGIVGKCILILHWGGKSGTKIYSLASVGYSVEGFYFHSYNTAGIQCALYTLKLRTTFLITLIVLQLSFLWGPLLESKGASWVFISFFTLSFRSMNARFYYQ